MYKIAIVLIFLSVFGCSSYDGKEVAFDNASAAPAPVMQKHKANNYAPGASRKITKNQRVIIMSAEIYLKVEDAKPLVGKFIEIAKKFKGYVLSSRETHTTIRIDSQEFRTAIAEIEKLGELKNKSISGQDVTNVYFDTKIRLDNALKSRKRYLQLLEKSGNVTEALQVERELERLNQQIDTLKGTLERYAHLATFSTINIYLEENKDKTRPGPLGYVFYGIYKGLKWLIVWD